MERVSNGGHELSPAKGLAPAHLRRMSAHIPLAFRGQVACSWSEQGCRSGLPHEDDVLRPRASAAPCPLVRIEFLGIDLGERGGQVVGLAGYFGLAGEPAAILFGAISIACESKNVRKIPTIPVGSGPAG